MTRTVTATGTVNPELTIIVGAAVSGIIKELNCDYNTKVKKGQVCARIDPRPYQSVVDENRANLAVAKAQLEKDKANLTYTKLALGRAATLLQTHAVSQDAYDSAKSTYDQAVAQITFDEATIQQRQASLDAAQVNLDYANIVSPVDGTVVSRNVTMGQTVASSFQTPTLFLIATDLAKMEVDANVSESDIGGIKLGNKATFTVDAYAKRTFRGNGKSGPSIPADRSERRDVRHRDQRGQFGPDAYAGHDSRQPDRRRSAQRRDPGAKPGAPLCSQRSCGRRVNPIRRRSGFCATEKPVAMPVVTGLDDDSFTEIVSGDVKPGDLVITAEQLATASKTVTPRL